VNGNFPAALSHTFFGNNTKKLPRRSSLCSLKGTKEGSMELVSSIHFATVVFQNGQFSANKVRASHSRAHSRRSTKRDGGFPLISVGIKELRAQKKASVSGDKKKDIACVRV